MKLNPFNPVENPMDAILYCFGGDGGGGGGGDSGADDFGFSDDTIGGYSGASDIGGTEPGGGSDDNDNQIDQAISNALANIDTVNLANIDTPMVGGAFVDPTTGFGVMQDIPTFAAPSAPNISMPSTESSFATGVGPTISGQVIRGEQLAPSVPTPVNTAALGDASFGLGRPDMPLQPTMTAPTIAPPSVSFPEQAQVIESLLGAPQVSEFVGPAGMGLLNDGVFTPAAVPVTEAGMQGDISPYTVDSAVNMAPSAYASQGVPSLGDITQDRAVQLDLAASQGTSSAEMDRSFFDRLNDLLGLSPDQAQRVAFQINVNPETGAREYGPVMQEAPTQYGETFGRMFGNAILGALGPLGLGFNIGDVRGYIDPVTGERYQYSEVGGIIPGIFGGGQPQLRSYAEMQAERDAEMARNNGGDGGGTPPAVPAVTAPPPAPIYAPALAQPQYRTAQLPFGGQAPTSQPFLQPAPFQANFYDIPERFRSNGLLG